MYYILVFVEQPSLRAWLFCFFTGGAQRETAERGDDRAVLRYKKDCYTGQNHVQQSFFVQKTDGALCSARYPGLPTPFPYSKQSRNCDASSNFIGCNPQKARRRKFRQQGSAHLCTTQKQRQAACLHAPQAVFPSSNKAFYKGGIPSPPQRDNVRTEGFLYWL